MMPISNQPVVVVACQVFQDLFARFARLGAVQKFIFLDYGLHRVPRKLNQAIQEALDALVEPSLVVLGYGLCGNGLNGIRAGKHTLLISRADDCIAILLGSYARYQREFKTESGTYYLTKGWLESGSNPLQEYQEYIQKYGDQEADWLIDSLYHNYKRLVFVVHDQADLEKYRPRALEVAGFCTRWGIRYEEILGSTEFFENLLERAAASSQSNEDFILVPPGGELRQEQFLRLET
ncbi:MAG: DUF1638 domain-containing protein [Methanoregula sp.]|jgi:hypothetical protein|uniref:DUF1638 domain-containing protein n=1 Tax=Methanoregula sp. TaxID=2052170 RepID=UPI003D0AB944